MRKRSSLCKRGIKEINKSMQDHKEDFSSSPKSPDLGHFFAAGWVLLQLQRVCCTTQREEEAGARRGRKNSEGRNQRRSSQVRFVTGKVWKQLAGASLTPLALGYFAAILLLLMAYGILEWPLLEQMTDFQPQSPNSTVTGGYPHKPLMVFGP